MPAGDVRFPPATEAAAPPGGRLAGDWTLSFLGAPARRAAGVCGAVAGDAGWDLAASPASTASAPCCCGATGAAGPTGWCCRPSSRASSGAWPNSGEATCEARAPYRLFDGTAQVGRAVFGFARHLVHFVALVGQLCLDLVYLLRYRGHWPLLEISANFYKVGVQAMPVTALVGFLIGVVLSYLSALQLQLFGADVFIVNILGFGIIRELGPVLVAVLVAGRSGSAMTAQIGVMRVTEEIDALTTMGISRYVRLVLPKVGAGAGDAAGDPVGSSMALFGGMVSANLQLGLSFDSSSTRCPGGAGGETC